LALQASRDRHRRVNQLLTPRSRSALLPRILPTDEKSHAQTNTFQRFARRLGTAFASGLGCFTGGDYDRDGQIRHILLISIDGMHAIDFANCVKGGYCPQMAELSEHALNFTAASSSKPSDSFPGLTALVTGGSPKSTGAFYDVSYDRALSPPKLTTPYGIPSRQ
jgi:hypothetical protein